MMIAFVLVKSDNRYTYAVCTELLVHRTFSEGGTMVKEVVVPVDHMGLMFAG